MWNKHFRYVASIALIVLAIALVVAIISLVYIMVKPGSFFITFSDLLFLAGGATLTVGAFIEFFMHSPSLRLGTSLLKLPDHLLKPAASVAETSEDKTSGGWMLIYVGALAIAISLISAFIGVK